MEKLLEKKLGRYIVKKYPIKVKCMDRLCGFTIDFFVIDCVACILRDAQVICPICKGDTLRIRICKGEESEEDCVDFTHGWNRAIEEFNDEKWRRFHG